MEAYSKRNYIKASADSLDLVNHITKAVTENLPFKLGKMRQQPDGQFLAYFDEEEEERASEHDSK